MTNTRAHDQMEGEMLAFEPTSLLELRWGPDVLRFELTPGDQGTALAFTATMLELGKAARDAAGWHTCLDRLRNELAGEQSPPDSGPDSGERWRELNRAYAARFGPEASTIGPPDEWERVHAEPASCSSAAAGTSSVARR